MEQLPDWIVLEYLEWVKQNINIYDYKWIFKEINEENLTKLASVYLRQNKHLSNNHITPEKLAVSAHKIINNRQKLYLIWSHLESISYNKYMIPDLSMGVDFLEWLRKNHLGTVKIEMVSIRTFKKLAQCFAIDCDKSNEEVKRLVHSFKKRKNFVPKEYLNSVDQQSDFVFLVQRYLDERIPFKCVILPLKINAEKLRDTIAEKDSDLNDLTKDYLDVYFSEKDFGES